MCLTKYVSGVLLLVYRPIHGEGEKILENPTLEVTRQMSLLLKIGIFSVYFGVNFPLTSAEVLPKKISTLIKKKIAENGVGLEIF